MLLRPCDSGSQIVVIDNQEAIVFDSQTGGMLECCTVSVRGDVFQFNDQRVTVSGYPQGKVSILIQKGAAIRNLVIRSNP